MTHDLKQSEYDKLDKQREKRKTLPQGRETSIDQRVRGCQDQDRTPDLDRLESVEGEHGAGG